MTDVNKRRRSRSSKMFILSHPPHITSDTTRDITRDTTDDITSDTTDDIDARGCWGSSFQPVKIGRMWSKEWRMYGLECWHGRDTQMRYTDAIHGRDTLTRYTDAILGRLRILEQPEYHLSQQITINQAITPNTQSQVTLKNIGHGFLHFTQPSEFQPLTRFLYLQVVPVSFAPMLICSWYFHGQKYGSAKNASIRNRGDAYSPDTGRATRILLSISTLALFRVVVSATLKTVKSLILNTLRGAPNVSSWKKFTKKSKLLWKPNAIGRCGEPGVL